VKTVIRKFLDSLPVMHVTLRSWEFTPPFPLLLVGDDSAVPSSKTERLKFIEEAAELLHWPTVHLDNLVLMAIEAFAIYRSQKKEDIAEDNPVFVATAQVAYQLALNSRDALQNLEIHAGHTPDADFHLAVQINLYDEHESTTTTIS